jgi:peptidoglycan/xylan/chitin deacetylase (PgdA/CDA1 family)
MSDGAIPADHSFALCLTHDVDRVRKTYQPLYYAVKNGDPSRLLAHLPGQNSFWQFENIMAIEEELGVRSAFYFLNERSLFRDKPLRTWLRAEYWKLYVGRYSMDDPAIFDVVRTLDAGGWEVGLHGSYESYRDTDRLRMEKEKLENVLGHPVLGGRQHYLNLDRPDTWRRHSEIGLSYDATLGQTDDYGFEHGYDPLRPFDDEFVVFPLTLMELTLPDVESDPEGAWEECEKLLAEARENEAVMTVLWHPSYFSDADHPNYGALYRRLIERAQEMGAWVGPPGELYASLEDRSAVESAEQTKELTVESAPTHEQQPTNHGPQQ